MPDQHKQETAAVAAVGGKGRVVNDRTEAEAVAKGARIVSAEFTACGKDWGYVVLRLDNGATLYADAPTLYAPSLHAEAARYHTDTDYREAMPWSERA